MSAWGGAWGATWAGSWGFGAYLPSYRVVVRLQSRTAPVLALSSLVA